MENTKLRSDVIGLLGAATLGVVMLSPAMTMYGVFGPSFLASGAATPLAFVWALIATLPTALSYSVLSRDYPVSGSAAAWAKNALGESFGIWAGWIVFFYYLTNFIIQPVTLGIFFGDFLKALHLDIGVASYIIGVLICTVWAGSLVYRGISISAKGALAFLLVEAGVVFSLCVTIIAVAHSTGIHLSLEGFTLRSSPTGASGVFRAVVFGMLAYCGFDVVSTLAEETKMARKLIPQATLLSLLIYAVFITFGVWCLSYGADSAQLKKIAEAGGMPITEVAHNVWGSGSILISITAISATLGLAIATSVGASRILYSMARDGLTLPAFGKLHSKYQIPWNSLHMIFACGAIGAFAVCALVGPYNSYVWWGTTSTFFAMLTYLIVNGANLILNRTRAFKSLPNFLLYFLVPTFGFIVDGYILYRSFFVELIAQDWATGKSVIAFDMLCALVALGLALHFKIFKKAPLSLRTEG